MTQGSHGYLATLGIDDGYFPLEYKETKGKTLLVGVLCVNTLPKGLTVTNVTVDGSDGTEKAAFIANEMVRRYPNIELDALFLDGVTVAGFNIINPSRLHKLLRLPVITVFKHPLNLDKVREALLKHFPDGESRYEVIREAYLSSKEVVTKWKKLIISCSGIGCSEAGNLISKLQVQGPLPEPLRLADLVASGLTRESSVLELLNRGGGNHSSSQSHKQSMSSQTSSSPSRH
jgi:endonuclease V-like protein UPF0215 family